MIVVVKDRHQGKTEALIKWLLEGHPISGYPGWSRGIVCVTRSAVLDTTARVQEATRNYEVTPPYLRGDPKPAPVAERWLVDLRKAIWSWEEINGSLRGFYQEFEYAIDDIDVILRNSLRINKMPTIVSITGDSYA